MPRAVDGWKHLGPHSVPTNRGTTSWCQHARHDELVTTVVARRAGVNKRGTTSWCQQSWHDELVSTVVARRAGVNKGVSTRACQQGRVNKGVSTRACQQGRVNSRGTNELASRSAARVVPHDELVSTTLTSWHDNLNWLPSPPPPRLPVVPSSLQPPPDCSHWEVNWQLTPTSPTKIPPGRRSRDLTVSTRPEICDIPVFFSRERSHDGRITVA